MNRENLLSELAETQKRIKGWTPATFDIDIFLQEESRKLDALPDAEFLVERDQALARIQNREREQRRDALVREHAARRWEMLVARRGELQRELEKNLPAELLAAISRMEGQIAARAEYGVSLFSFSSSPGGTLHRSTKARTPADERAEARAREALAKLQSLATAPAADVAAGIAQIIKALAEGDAADLPAVKRIEKPAPTAVLADAMGNTEVIAEIEADRPSRERLLPAG